MFQTQDLSVIHRIANDPSVVTSIGHDPATGQIAFFEHLKEPHFWQFMTNHEDCAAIFQWSAPKVWESHTMFLPEARGKKAIHHAKLFIREMFLYQGAKLLWGQTPVDLQGAHMFNRLVGAKFDREHYHNSLKKNVKIYEIERDIWFEKFPDYR